MSASRFAQARQRYPKPAAFRRALTLIESLVILGVTLMLLTVAVPSVARARQASTAETCIGRLAGIAKAGLTYAGNDPHELMIPVPEQAALPDLCGAFEWGGKSGLGQPTEPSRTDTSAWGTRHYRGPAHRPLNAVLVKTPIKDWNPTRGPADPGPDSKNYLDDTRLDLSMVRCPDDTGYAGGGFMYTAGHRDDQREKAFKEEKLTAYDHYGTSYAANMLWVLGGSVCHQIRSQSVYLSPVSRVPAPGDTVAYLEVPARFAWMWGSWRDSGCESAGYERRVEGNTNPIPGWHGKEFAFSVGFVDGHADRVVMKGCTRPPTANAGGGYTSVACEPGTDPGECLRCVTIRGEGWRLDTLPAPSVATPWMVDGERWPTVRVAE